MALPTSPHKEPTVSTVRAHWRRVGQSLSHVFGTKEGPVCVKRGIENLPFVPEWAAQGEGRGALRLLGTVGRRKSVSTGGDGHTSGRARVWTKPGLALCFSSSGTELRLGECYCMR